MSKILKIIALGLLFIPTLLFKVRDYKELAKKIIFFHSNKKLWHKMMLIGNKRLKRFNYNFNLKKYFNVIKNYL